MGLDLRIEDGARWFVTGTGRTWQGEQTWDREEFGEGDHLLSLEYFFESLESGDVRVWSEEQQPPLPEDAKELSAHWSYGGFGRFRERVAEAIGIENLGIMWGFKPITALGIADLRGVPRPSGNADYAAFEKEQDEWWYENNISWDTIDSPLVPFLHHSDADGEMSPEECAQVAPALAKIVNALPDDGIRNEHDRQEGRKLVRMMEVCAEYNRILLFR